MTSTLLYHESDYYNNISSRRFPESMARGRSIIEGGGGGANHINIFIFCFIIILRKLIVVTVCEPELMNMGSLNYHSSAFPAVNT